jgi:hypothetical protein
MLFANPKNLHDWKLQTVRSRFDYDCPDHLLGEMMHEHYWSTVMVEVNPGDIIHVTAADNEQAIVRIDWKDTTARTVGMSVIERLTERPIPTSNGYTIKYRGPRGGLWCVLHADGNIVVRDLRTQDEASRRMQSLVEQRAA